MILDHLIEAKYVQFLWKNGYNNSNIGVRELEVLTAPARGSAVIASSSQDELASNCIDLDPTNQWTTTNGHTTNQWVKLSLPRAEVSTHQSHRIAASDCFQRSVRRAKRF